MMTACEIRTLEPYLVGASANFDYSGVSLRKNSRSSPTSIETTWGGIERGERNVALLNIVALAHALKVRPARLLDPIS